MKTQTFTIVSNNLLASKKLNCTEKLFISYIIGYQQNNKECFETNASLATKFGLTVFAIRKMIVKLNKYEWFNSTKYGTRATSENWTSTHTITIDENKLQLFLNEGVIDVVSEIEQPIEEIKETKVEIAKQETKQIVEVVKEQVSDTAITTKPLTYKYLNSTPQHYFNDCLNYLTFKYPIFTGEVNKLILAPNSSFNEAEKLITGFERHYSRPTATASITATEMIL